MFDTLKSMVGIEKTDYAQMVKDGAIVLDVRSKGEYDCGHIDNSINISVDQLENNLHRFKDQEKTIITCCASGMRSDSAKSLLKTKGYKNVYNGGSWLGLNQKIS
ncbi:MAG: phage shock protein E [Cyclobacteriaceae bacterium]|jgi:rhodanese-related sulfurtransferase